jgi:hypothetical protein
MIERIKPKGVYLLSVEHISFDRPTTVLPDNPFDVTVTCAVQAADDFIHYATKTPKALKRLWIWIDSSTANGNFVNNLFDVKNVALVIATQGNSGKPFQIKRDGPWFRGLRLCAEAVVDLGYYRREVPRMWR